MQVVLITGVSRGLGRAMVGEFISRGATVCGCARSAEAVEELSRQHGEPHRFEVVDVVDDEAVARWTGEVAAHPGVPDLLVNNAALVNANAALWDVPRDEVDAVIDVNLKGAINVIRHVVPGMVARGSGVIATFSSYWGVSTAPDVAPYCTTKWGVEGLARALAQDLPEGLASVAFNPGIIDTRMLRSCFGDSAAGYPKPEEWARGAVPLLMGLSPRDNGRTVTAG